MAHSKDKLKLQHIQRVVESQLKRYEEKLTTCDPSEALVIKGQIRMLDWVLGYFTFEDDCKRGEGLKNVD